MARRPPQPLTPAQAKARLRHAARRASPTAWVSRHPLTALATAAAAGFLLARDPRISGTVLGLLARGSERFPLGGRRSD